MKYYLAPLEGVTGYIYRNAHHAYFGNVDKYFSPFIVPNQSGRLRTKELNDIRPENTQVPVLIPQILTNKAEDFIITSKMLKEYGYSVVNLNLGCPSGTVVSKYRGSGFLSKQKELDQFLEEIFTASVSRISIKTRIGMSQPEEFYELIEIYNKYPIDELIIHPRTREDYYNNKPNLSIFEEGLTLSKNPVCYNGDIRTVEDYNAITKRFPDVETVMIGRGLISNPGLINSIKDNSKLDKSILKEFHDKILMDYQGIISGDRNVLFKMKELWFYMITMFANHEKYAKKIKKADHLYEYEEAVSNLFHEQELISTFNNKALDNDI